MEEAGLLARRTVASVSQGERQGWQRRRLAGRWGNGALERQRDEGDILDEAAVAGASVRAANVGGLGNGFRFRAGGGGVHLVVCTVH